MADRYSAKTRALAQSLFINGLFQSQIADQLGIPVNTVCTWIKRGEWTQLRANTKTALASKGNKTLAVQLAQASSEIRLLLTNTVQGIARDIAKLAVGPKSLERRVDLVNKLVPSASKLLGWQDNTSSTHLVARIDLGTVKQVERKPQPKQVTQAAGQEDNDPQVIDVSAVKAMLPGAGEKACLPGQADVDEDQGGGAPSGGGL